MWMQHLVVLALVLGAGAIIAWQAFSALRGRASSIGGCGSCKGCSTVSPAVPAAQPPRTRIVFLPSDSIGIRRHSK